jgi:hypothetical protein
MPYRGFSSKSIFRLAVSGISSSYGPGIRGVLNMIDHMGLFIKGCTQPLEFLKPVPSEESRELIISQLTTVLEEYLVKKYNGLI